ncbi:LysR substrate-binding domain-containing protein [Pokkaliibacter sp. CJK22405]|uniref:LysR substrate-binding domain-containing protein n=1 Tax=Pokkaliibacter sp. CJK22405 TaxID=3384615 RepID=UPI003984E9D9
MRITLRQLQVFVAIARKGSVSAAAEQIGLTQSAASMALAELENHLGAPLFDRLGRRLRLSPLGETQLPLAEDILNQVETFEQSGSRAIAGPFTLASSMTIGSYLLPRLALDFLADYPDVDLKLRLRNSADVLHALLNLDADLGLIEGLCREPRLACVPWRQDRLFLVAAPDSPWASCKGRPEKLLEAPWILRESGSGTRAVLEQVLGKDSHRLHVRLELAHHEAIKQAVLAGLGVGCLSELAVQEDLAAGRLIDLSWPGLDLTRSLSLVWWPERYLSGAARAMIQCLGLEAEVAEATANWSK